MKRDLDYLRELLLEIEASCEIGKALKKSHSFDETKNSETLKAVGHVKLLIDEGFIECVDTTSQEKNSYLITRLTNSGHDYLGSVKDPKIWRDTKAGLAKAGGSTSLAIVQATAVAIFKASLAKAGINI